MSALSSILGDLGIGSSSIYSFNQQQKDFIKLRFRYALLLKQKLASGDITQDYFDANAWLTTENLDAPYVGWYDEFKKAVDSEDLNWLAKQVGETVDSLTSYMGDALSTVASHAASLVGTAISSTSTGLVKGFFGSLNPVGWLVVIGLGVAVFYGFKTGTIQRSLKLAAIV